MNSSGALESVDLRQLESFLTNADSNRVLGNLFRNVTVRGHVKWICIDHFRDTVDALHASFDENIGRVEVTLQSRMQAEQVYLALELAKSVYELKVGLYWETTQSDFKKLRDTFQNQCWCAGTLP